MLNPPPPLLHSGLTFSGSIEGAGDANHAMTTSAAEAFITTRSATAAADRYNSAKREEVWYNALSGICITHYQDGP